MLNHENVNVRNIGQGEAQHRMKRFKLGGGRTYRSVDCGYNLEQYMSN
jgi:hypothetical protein